jgi:hypothetical protein
VESDANLALAAVWMNDPLWRKILCWGAVISFFLLPLVAFVVVVSSVLVGAGLSDQEVQNFKAFSGYQATLGALVFGLAGLNTWQQRNGK